jgi:hypothetical protein
MNPFQSPEAVPRNISLQPLNGMLEGQLAANWARLLKGNGCVLLSFSPLSMLTESQGTNDCTRNSNCVRPLPTSLLRPVSPFSVSVEGTGHYLSFIDVTSLEKQLWHEQYRARIHPGFIWACLAMARLMRSSSVEDGQAGLQIALALFQEAKNALEIAWADPTYAYAALVRHSPLAYWSMQLDLRFAL